MDLMGMFRGRPGATGLVEPKPRMERWLGGFDDPRRLMMAQALMSVGDIFGSDGRGNGGGGGTSLAAMMQMVEQRRKAQARAALAERQGAAAARVGSLTRHQRVDAIDQATGLPTALTPEYNPEELMGAFTEADAAGLETAGARDILKTQITAMTPEVGYEEGFRYNKKDPNSGPAYAPSRQAGMVMVPDANAPGGVRAETLAGYNPALAKRVGAEEYGKGPDIKTVLQADGRQVLVPTARGIAPEGMPAHIPGGLAPRQEAPRTPAEAERMKVVAPDADVVASVTERDIDALTRMIATEAAGEGEVGMAAAGHVALNRLRNRHGGASSLREVVYAPGQFEGMARAGRVNPKDYARARQIATQIVGGALPDPTNGAVNFINPDLQAQMGRRQPNWAPRNGGQRIGRHVFYGGRQLAGSAGSDDLGGSAGSDTLAPPPPEQGALVGAPVYDPGPASYAVQGDFRPGTVTQRNPRGDLEVLQAAPAPPQPAAPLTPEAMDQRQFERANTLRSRLEEQTTYQNYMKAAPFGRTVGNLVQAQEQRIAAGQPPSAPADIALIFSFMKSLDPGSTVMQGEQATARNAASIPDKLRNTYNEFLRSGDTLTPAQRRYYLDAVQQAISGHRAGYEAEVQRYRGLAEDYGLNPDLIMEMPQAAAAQQPVGEPSQNVRVRNVKTGEIGSNAQAATLAMLRRNGAYDPKAPDGSVYNPRIEPQGGIGQNPTPGFFVGLDGVVRRVNDNGSIEALPQGIRRDQGFGFTEGFRKPVSNAAEGLEYLAENVMRLPKGTITNRTVDRWEANRAEQERQGRLPGRVGQVAGEVAATAPLFTLPGGALAQGAAAGGLLTDASSPLGVAADVLAGAAGGKIGEEVLRAGTRLLPQSSLQQVDAMVRRTGVPQARAPKRAPNVESLRQIRDEAYATAEQIGARWRPEAVGRMADRVEAKAAAELVDPLRHPKAASMVREFGRLRDREMSLQELDQFRQVIRDDVASSADKAERRHGAWMLKEIDRLMERATPADMASGNPRAAAASIKLAREAHSRLAKFEAVQEAAGSARRRAATTGSGGNVDNATRQNIERLAKKQRFRPEEKRALDRTVYGDRTQNVLRNVGKLSPQGNGLMGMLGTLGAVGGAAMGGVQGAGAMATIPAVGMVAKTAADRITQGRVTDLLRTIAAGGKTGAAADAELAALAARDPTLAALRNQLAATMGLRLGAPVGTAAGVAYGPQF